MRKLFEEYGTVIVVVVAIVALIALVITLMQPSGPMGKAFEDIIQSFVDKTNDVVDGEGGAGGSGGAGNNGNVLDDSWPIEWNTLAVLGNTTDSSDALVKVSRLVPSAEELASAQAYAPFGGAMIVLTYAGRTIDGGAVMATYTDSVNSMQFFVVSVPAAGEYAAGDYYRVVVTEPGLYVLNLGHEDVYGLDMDVVLEKVGAPEAPTVASVSDNSITLNVIEGCEYSMDGYSWQDSPTFNGLTPGSKYTLYARFKATSTNSASPSSSVETRTTGYADFVVTSSNRDKVGYTSTTTTLIIPETFYDASTDSYYKVVEIENEAFYDCDNLTSVTVPDSVIAIGISDYLTSASGAFEECDNLSAVNFGENSKLECIGQGTFYGCDSLTSITIPDSVIVIGLSTDVLSAARGVFGECDNLSAVNFGENSKLECIGQDAFYGCDSLTSITIPNNVATIGHSAFAHCTSLTSITIPDSVTNIRHEAFSHCSSLTSVTMGNNSQLTSIGDSAFGYCSELTSMEIPDGVTSIGEWAFQHCSGLTSVTMGNSVTAIGDNAFNGCANLTNITVPDSVTTIGDYAFYQCSSLTGATIGNNVTSIGKHAFDSCTSLTSVTMGNSVTSIGNSAFDSCTSLTSVTMGNSVTSIGNSAFRSCSSLTSITIPDGVTSIGDSVFSGCSGLTSITIPDGVTAIGDFAFCDCNGLTSITMSNSVTSIGSYAFSFTPRPIGRTVSVTFEGTVAEWDAISLGEHWKSANVINQIICSDGTVNLS